MLRHLLNRTTKSFSTTIFDKVLNKSIPTEAVYEDQHVYAFNDINPQAPVHVLIIPKLKDGLTGISQAQKEHKSILGHMLFIVPTIAAKLGLTNGYRLVINEGADGCQSVLHLHIHVLGGRQLLWPPG